VAQGFRVHSGAGIANRQAHEFPGMSIALTFSVAFIDVAQGS
jgi:hypothetical protein